MTVEYHGGSQPAVNVKDNVLYAQHEPYATLIERVGEEVADGLYECAREGFWMNADQLADDFDYGEAFSEGRSGGWLVVSNPPDLDEVPSDTWLAFVGAIESAMSEARATYAELMREHIAGEQFEHSESAAMAARDIETVGT